MKPIHSQLVGDGSLRAGNAATTRVDLGRNAQSAGERFEQRFCFVMVVAPMDNFGRHRYACMDGKRLEEVVDEISWELTDGGRVPLSVKDAVGASAKVERDKTERFIHWHIGVTDAIDALAVAQRLIERFAQDDCSVFDGVMRVDPRVPLSLHTQVEKAVDGERGQHMGQEADRGVDFGRTDPIDIQFNFNLCLFRLSRNGCCSVHQKKQEQEVGSMK